MDLCAFGQACLATRRLTALSECLQDHMEDRKAEARLRTGGVLGLESDLMLNLVAGIHEAGSQVVELMAPEASRKSGQELLPALEDNFVLAASEMLMAVTDVSRACEQLHQSPFALVFALPDFSLLSLQSADLTKKLQRHVSAPLSGHF